MINLKLKIKSSKKSKGFTMIELLIVIAVLGVLAVAVLSAINPIEMINRGKDTGTRSDAEQLLSAIDRYYTSQSYFPWQTESLATNPQIWAEVATTWVDDDTPAVSVLTKLSSGGTQELKASFVTRITSTNNTPLWVFNAGTQGDSTYICFLPKSKSFVTEATDRCTKQTLPSDYPTLGAGGCDICGGQCDPANPTGQYFICLP